MAIKSEIESAIQSIIDAGTFQNLCNEILCREIDAPITTLGSQTGTNKTTKGTPDAYFTLGSKFIFVEYTTIDNESKNLFNKIASDIDKCLDETQTKVPVNQIIKIICCHTSSNLTPDFTNQLNAKCNQKKVKLEIWGINELANKIKNKYPYIAEDYLNLKIGSGQIYDLKGFIRNYNSNKTTASLDTKFLFRKAELSSVENSIRNSKITLLKGFPGTGKTRLAVEVLKKNKKSYSIICIKDRNEEFGNDFLRYLDPKKENLIFVDDANSFGQKLNTILDLVNDTCNKVKVLFTVRENFSKDVELLCSKYSEFASIDIKPFEDKEIEEFLKENFNISNPNYVKQIQRISEGNARLAYFAAKCALDENGYENIQNAEQLFDTYYGNLLNQLSVADEKLFKTAGIISVLKMIDKNKLSTISCFLKLCSLNESEFVLYSKILKEKELVNDFHGHLFIDEQCISNYFSYQFVYKKQFFNFADYLTICYENYPQQIVSNLNTIAPIFSSEDMFNSLSESVKSVWNTFQGKKIEHEFVKAFCCLAPENTLVYLYEKIDLAKKTNIGMDEIILEPRNTYITDPIIEIIGCMGTSDKTCELIELLCMYLEKSPNKIKDAVSVVDSYFKIDKNSYKNGYSKELNVVNTILQFCTTDIINLFFIEVSKNYLLFTGENIEQGRHLAISFLRFSIPSCDEIKKIREKIWTKLIELIDKSFRLDRIIFLFESYSSGWDDNEDKNLLIFDIVFIEKIVEELYKKRSIKTLSVLFILNRKLKHFKLPEVKINHYADLFLLDVIETFNNRSFDEKVKKVILDKFLTRNQNLNLDSLVKIINQCSEEKCFNSATYNFHYFLSLLNDDDFYLITKSIIKYGNSIRIEFSYFLQRLWNILSIEDLKNFICNNLIEDKNEWKFYYFQTMPESFITLEVYNDFLAFLISNEDKNIKNPSNRNLDFIRNYLKFDKNCYEKIFSIIKEKYEYNPNIFFTYSNSIFNEDSKPNDLCFLFESNLNLLFDIYIICTKHTNYFDYDGIFFLFFIENFEIFIEKYVDFLIEEIKDDKNHSLLDNDKNIIKAKNYVAIFDKIFSKIKDKKIDYFGVEKLEILFNSDMDKINNYVFHYIDINFNDRTAIRNLFSVLSKFSWNMKLNFITHLLNKTDDYELFSSLKFEGTLETMSGSFVPLYETEIKFWENLEELIPNTAKYFRHKKFCSENIEKIKHIIDYEIIEDKYRNMYIMG